MLNIRKVLRRNEIVIIGILIGIIGIVTCCVGCSKWTEAKVIEEKQNADRLAAQQVITNYYQIAENNNLMKVYKSDELTEDILINRQGKLIIEMALGKCIDGESGAGVSLYDNSYIAYNNVVEVKTGDIVCSYFIYNPETNYIDDIVGRYDFVIDSQE